MNEEKILFEDKHVKITDRRLIIKCYYFPFSNSKSIRFEQINKVQVRDLGILRMRIWGMSAFAWGYWFPGDCNRPNRDQYIAIYIDSWVTPTFTTDHTMVAFNILNSELQKYREGKSRSNAHVAHITIENDCLQQKDSMERRMLRD